MEGDQSKVYHGVDSRKAKVRKEAQWFIYGVSLIIDNHLSFSSSTTVGDHVGG